MLSCQVFSFLSPSPSLPCAAAAAIGLVFKFSVAAAMWVKLALRLPLPFLLSPPLSPSPPSFSRTGLCFGSAYQLSFQIFHLLLQCGSNWIFACRCLFSSPPPPLSSPPLSLLLLLPSPALACALAAAIGLVFKFFTCCCNLGQTGSWLVFAFSPLSPPSPSLSFSPPSLPLSLFPSPPSLLTFPDEIRHSTIRLLWPR